MWHRTHNQARCGINQTRTRGIGMCCASSAVLIFVSAFTLTQGPGSVGTNYSTTVVSG